MNRIFRELCIEVASGDIGSDRFNRLWIETGIPLEGQEFEIANRILARAREHLIEELRDSRTYH